MKNVLRLMACLLCITISMAGCSSEQEEGVTGDTTPTPEYTDP